MQNLFRRDAPVDVYNKTRVSGASADTAIKTTPGMIYGILVGTAGAASSLISLYDGAVSGTAYAEIDGTVVKFHGPLKVNHAASIHIKTVDSGGNLEVTVLWR